MCALDYLKLLNEETKERLIGLCLDRKLLLLDEESEYEEGEESDESAFDEMDETSFLNSRINIIFLKHNLNLNKLRKNI